jgi:hypothetical protein
MSKVEKRYQEALGKKFGRLTVIEIIKTVDNRGKALRKLKCLCECGKTSEPRLNKLIDGDTVSCGCLRNEKRRKAFFARRGNKRTEDMTMLDWK